MQKSEIQKKKKWNIKQKFPLRSYSGEALGSLAFTEGITKQSFPEEKKLKI